MKRWTMTGLALLFLVSVTVVVGAGNPDATSAGSARSEFRLTSSFSGAIEAVTEADLGPSWRPGCPVGPGDLRRVVVDHWGYDGTEHRGQVIVAALQADAVLSALRTLYDERFPIERMENVALYGADDNRSMEANNTSAFNCRTVAGRTTWSEHSFGTAIDINPVQNPYVSGSFVSPPAGQAWTDRGLRTPGMILADGPVVRAFAAIGWLWGGDWRTVKDYQHFSASGR